MWWHRPAQRLQGLLPALQGQNKLQQNNSQELKSSDFEGSRFDRWLCQGSGQHPLAGSPQHQRAFVIATGRPGEWPAACCSGALAVLFGSGQSPKDKIKAPELLTDSRARSRAMWLGHRPAQRLRVSSPALQGQNKLQQNNSQELKSSDFEGSRFDRWLCQGSGQHPLAGSPQHQRAFVIATGRPGEWPAACCSGALAVLSERSERFPSAGRHYYQGRHQGRGLCSADAGASADCISSVCRRSICWSFMASWAVSVSIRPLVPCSCPGASAGASAPPISTFHRPSCLCALSASALIRLRTVSAEIPRCVAASLIDKSMGFTVAVALGGVTYSAYADCGQFGGAR